MTVTDENLTEELLRRRHAKPFVPFAIVLSNGERHVIREPYSFTATNGKVMLPNRTTGGLVPIGDVVDIADVADPKRLSAEEARVREDLILHLLRRPFAPFTIAMRDGRRYEIVRRLQAGVGETRGYLVNADETQGTNFHVRDIGAIEQRVTV